jgi:3'-5' exoribonuclease
MASLQLPTLAPGDRVQHELLVFDRTERKTSAGDPFVILTLGNATGRIETAPIWSNELQMADGANPGRVVQAIGEVTLYGKSGTAKRQLKLIAPVRPMPMEQVDIYQFLPSIGDCTRLWDWIDRTRDEIESQKLRQLVDLFFGDDGFRYRFEKTPASAGGHHAKVGGLLMHTFEVTNIARQTARTMRANVDLAVTGALLHDIGKVEAYTIGPGGFTTTPCGILVGHVVLGVLMLEQRVARLPAPVCTPGQLLDVQHMILSHHGALEFGSPVQPATVEAEIVHWADEASAKATDMMDSLDDPEGFPDGGELSKRAWRVGRRVWKRPHSWD